MALPHESSTKGRRCLPAARVVKRRALQRWTNHLAIWVVLGGVAGAAHCRRRPAAPPSIDAPPRVVLEPTIIDLGCSADRQLVRHVVGL
jgi:hypothetical protein